MKIAIDIDDTLTNTKQQQIKLWKKYYNNNPHKDYSEKLPQNINEWGDKYIEDFWDTYRELLSFNSSYKDNVSEVIDKLLQDGHQLYIVTSRPQYKYNNLISKIKKALNDNKIHIDNIYTDIYDKGKFCKDNKFDLLIDDDIKHIKSAQKNGIKTILFNEYKNYDGVQATTWKEVYKKIKMLK